MKGLRGAWAVLALVGGIAGAQSIEERVKALEEKMEEGQAPEPGTPAALAAGKKIDVFFNEGIKFKSADGNIDAHLGGRVIVHWRNFLEHNDRLQKDTFAFRQVKLHLQGKIWKDWEFKVELNTTGAATALDDGYLGFVRWKQFQVRVGQFKAPFSLEELTSTRFIDLPERSMMNRLVPAREVGIMVHGEVIEKILGYAVMLSNGNGRNGPDDNSDKDLTGRVYVRPFGTSESDWLKNFHIGGAMTWGRREGGPATAPYTFSNIFTGTTFAALGGDAGSIKFDESRYRYQGELAWLFGPGHFKAEYTRTNDQYTELEGFDNHHHTHFTGFYVQAGWILTGEMKGWDRIRPDRPLFGSAGGFGALEAVFRYSEFQINKEIVDHGYFNAGNTAREVHEYALGLNWWPTMNTRISVAYAYVNYSSDASTKPITLGGKAIDHEDVLLVRFQVDF